MDERPPVFGFSADSRRAGLRGAILDLLYPPPIRCLCCGDAEPKEGGLICPACAQKLSEDAPKSIANGDSFDAIAAHAYAGTAGALVRALKYRAVPALARGMGDEIYWAMRAFHMPIPDRVAFVPMHFFRRRKKPFNQSELIARAVAQNMGMSAERILKRVRICRQQARMKTREARARNVRGAFRAIRPLEGLTILLVDDVYTTGATARECANALFQAGAREVLFVAYALGGT